jgi:hypothetical protein
VPHRDGSEPRVLTQGVTRSLHVYYKSARIKQYHKEECALRTETTINNTYDFRVGKRLINLPKLREIGFAANHRLLEIERLSHDCDHPRLDRGDVLAMGGIVYRCSRFARGWCHFAVAAAGAFGRHATRA